MSNLMQEIKDTYIEKNANKNHEAIVNFRTSKNLYMRQTVNTND